MRPPTCQNDHKLKSCYLGIIPMQSIIKTLLSIAFKAKHVVELCATASGAVLCHCSIVLCSHLGKCKFERTNSMITKSLCLIIGVFCFLFFGGKGPYGQQQQQQQHEWDEVEKTWYRYRGEYRKGNFSKK